MSLTGREQLQLAEAVAAEFDYDALQASVRKIHLDLPSITGRDSMTSVALDLVRHMIETERLWHFVAHLALERRDQALFSDFARLLLAADAADAGVRLNVRTDGLQRLVRDRGGFVALKPVERLSQAVCRIRYTTTAGKVHGGTGFLIAPDLVMTNYHVVELLLGGKADLADVQLVFDHYIEADGITTHPGARCGLDAQTPWLGFSPYSDLDNEYSESPLSVPDGELDYAILRLETLIGSQPISAVNRTLRGWIAIENRPSLPATDEPLLIIQHPAGEAMAFAYESPSILEHNPNENRTRHQTATEDGSSGSPCFNGRYKLVGLHNGADPTRKRRAKYNQMVPLRAIRAHMEAHPGQLWAKVQESIALAPAPAEQTVESVNGPDPQKSYLLPGKYAFLDRTELRTVTQHFNTSGDRVLIVNGHKNTGKSHTKRFLFHLAQCRHEQKEEKDQFTPIWVDLAPLARAGTTQPMTGLRLATQIVNQIPNLNFPVRFVESFEEGKEQRTIWAENVGTWLTGELKRDPTIYWFIIDSYGKATRDPSVDYLLDELIRQVSNTLDSVRLVLLDYEPTNFLDQDVGRHEDESQDLTDPANSTRLIKEVGKFLLQADPHTFTDLDNPAAQEKLRDETNSVLASIDPNRGGQMAKLGREMRKKAQELERGVA